MDNEFIFRSSAKYSEEGMEPRAREILRRLLDVNIDDMSEDELESLERIMSHGIACIKCEVGKRKGIQKEKVSTEMRSDMLIRDINHDHAYSKYSKDGEVFISEPYCISNEDILSMATAINEGYDAIIDGNGQHFPGRTVRILVRKKIAKELYDLVSWGNF